MKSFFVFALLVATAIANDFWVEKNMVRPAALENFEDPVYELGISGGKVVSISDYPYQLSMRMNGSHFCGASIISSNWTLSAAHCTYPMPSVEWISFRAGSSNRLYGGKIYAAAEIINHPSFNPTTLDYDVCVIRITGIFHGDHIALVPLVPSGTIITSETRSAVSGWGKTSDSTKILPFRLRAVDIPVVSESTCEAQWAGHNFTDRVVCAGEPGRSSCKGDAGGPLVTGGRQFGIWSWGASHCGSSLAGIYTNVGNDEIRSFISNNTGV